MPESRFDAWIAAHYEKLWPELFEPAALEPVIDVLTELAAGGPILEFGIGTGRVALPLHRRGIPVHGIELSPAMAARLRTDPDADGIEVTLGDFATATAGGPFTLIYLLRKHHHQPDDPGRAGPGLRQRRRPPPPRRLLPCRELHPAAASAPARPGHPGLHRDTGPPRLRAVRHPATLT